MCYTLHCLECAIEISAQQYDANLGLCADCAKEAFDLDSPAADAMAADIVEAASLRDTILGLPFAAPVECTCPRREPCRPDCNLPRRDSRK